MGREERMEVRGGGKEARKREEQAEAAATSLRSFILRLLANTSSFPSSTLMGWISEIGSHL